MKKKGKNRIFYSALMFWADSHRRYFQKLMTKILIS